MLAYLAFALLVSIAINAALFIIAFVRKSDKLTDASYALSFIALAGFGLLRGPLTIPRLLVAALVTVWALRLGGFLLYRIWRAGVDHRFDDMRDNFWRFGRFWFFQALTVWVVSLAALLALAHSGVSNTAVMGVGALVWLVGFLAEAAADLQKYRFTQDPKNKGHWIDRGLWHYSRHPNYFGEMLVWLGIYLVAVPSLRVAELLVAALSPLFIMSLLLFVSGIPILEKSADQKWGSDPAYRKYKARTSLLVPWPPRG